MNSGLDFVCSMEDAAGKRGRKDVLKMTAGITKDMRREVYRRDGWRCALCVRA